MNHITILLEKNEKQQKKKNIAEYLEKFNFD